MKNNLLKIAVFIFILLLLNGCATYQPMSVDIPLIKNKGDIRLDVGGFLAYQPFESGEDVLAGGQATFSAGLTDIVATQTYVSIDATHKIHLQGAMGLYKKIDNETVIELYSGYGVGWICENNNFNYHLAFSQFNIGKTGIGAKKYIDYGLGLKGGYLFVGNYGDKNNAKYQNNSGYYQYYFRDYPENVWLFEPSIFFRFGGRRAKLSTRVNYLLINKKIDVYYLPLSISAGVNFSFGKR